MKLQKLVAELDIECKGGNKECEVTGLCSNSKQLTFGNLFIAEKGCKEAYIEEAIANGALGIVTEIYNPFFPDHVMLLLTKDVAKIAYTLALRFYKEPSSHLFMIGVTGTNGKTTITYLLKQLCEHLKLKTGLMGTNGIMIGRRILPTMHTTPDMMTNQKLLREMVKSECTVAVMEVSSHGLAQKRTDLIDFDVAIFTNLTQDHLDYHKDMESYFAAKALFFSQLGADKVAVLPEQGEYARRLKEMTKAKVITYGFSEEAMVRATELSLSLEKSTFTVHYKQETVKVTLPLLGRFNVCNYLAALSALLAKGATLSDLIEAPIKGVRGRMERVSDKGIFIDYAHTPDALKNALQTLREFVLGRLIVVFGCGGERDKEKRPLMGEVAIKYADVVIVTSDNPRGEDPMQIAQEIVGKGEAIIEVDRERAIAKALEIATSKDLILIAGKGHESTQVFAHKTIEFDDRVQVERLLTQCVAN